MSGDEKKEIQPIFRIDFLMLLMRISSIETFCRTKIDIVQNLLCGITFVHKGVLNYGIYIGGKSKIIKSARNENTKF